MKVTEEAGHLLALGLIGPTLVFPIEVGHIVEGAEAEEVLLQAHTAQVLAITAIATVPVHQEISMVVPLVTLTTNGILPKIPISANLRNTEGAPLSMVDMTNLDMVNMKVRCILN